MKSSHGSVASSLTDAQRRALSPQHSVWVHASAGSGKTRVLTERIMGFLVNGVSPDQILCVTFTRKAVQEIDDRIRACIDNWSTLNRTDLTTALRDLLGHDPVDKHFDAVNALAAQGRSLGVAVRTFHGFCHDLMMTFPMETGTHTSTSVLSQAESLAVWRQAFDQVMDANTDVSSVHHDRVVRLARHFMRLDDVLTTLFLARSHGQDAFRSIDDAHRSDCIALFHAIMPVYDQIKGDAMDMDDLLARTLALFDNSMMSGWVMHTLNQNFRHILLDESQDTSPTQWAIFRFVVESVITNAYRTVFVVGDPKQSIYSFQGANLNDFFVMHTFVQEWVKAHNGQFRNEAFHLSFRSCSPIIRCVNHMFRTHDVLGVPFHDHIAYHETRTGCVQFDDLTDHDNGADFWTQRIQQWLDMPFFLPSQNRFLQKKDIMVLLPRRTQFFSDLSARFLDKKWIVSVSCHRTDNAVLDVLLCLGQWMMDCHHDDALSGLLRLCFANQWPDILFHACHERGHRSIWAHMCALAQKHSVWHDVVAILTSWKDSAGLYTLDQWYSHVLWGRHGIDQWNVDTTHALHTIDAFLDALERYTGSTALADCIQDLSEDPKRLNVSYSGHDHVQLTTIHGAKGLQAPVVIVPDLAPAFKKENDEYWRLLYVAMTRAQDRLYMSARHHRPGWAMAMHTTFDQLTHTDTTHQDPVYSSLADGQNDKDISVAMPEWLVPIQGNDDVNAASDPVLKTIPVHSADAPRDGDEKGQGVGPGCNGMPALSWADDTGPAHKDTTPYDMPSSLRVTGADKKQSDQQQPGMHDAFAVFYGQQWGAALHQLLDELPHVHKDQWLDKSMALLRKKGMSTTRARMWAHRLIDVMNRADLHDILFNALCEQTIKTPLGVVRCDRILVQDHEVWIVDFKSGAMHTVQPFLHDQYKDQMVNYGHALRSVYPGYRIRLSLVWLASGSIEDIPYTVSD